MKPYAQLTPAERAGEYAGLKAEWDALKAQGLAGPRGRDVPPVFLNAILTGKAAHVNHG